MTADYIDVAGVLDGTVTAPQTTSGGRRSDGVPLLYGPAVNVLVGAPEAGKTLVAGGMAADELFSHGSCLWADLDHNGAAALLHRLISFGVHRDILTDPARFRLALPEDAEAVAEIVTDAVRWRPSLAIVDSVGELLPMFGANSNDADDYTRVHRAVLTRLAGAGAAVLALDHEAKGIESRAYGATGSAAKKRAVDGALLRVSNVRPFAPETGGEAHLTVVKDRHGALRALAGGREPTVARFVLSPVTGGMHYRFELPAYTAPASAADVDLLAGLMPPPANVRDIKARMGWGSTRAAAAWRDFQDVPREQGSGNASGNGQTTQVSILDPAESLGTTVPGTPGNVPGTPGESVCSPVPPPLRGERGNAPRNTRRTTPDEDDLTEAIA